MAARGSIQPTRLKWAWTGHVLVSASVQSPERIDAANHTVTRRCCRRPQDPTGLQSRDDEWTRNHDDPMGPSQRGRRLQSAPVAITGHLVGVDHLGRRGGGGVRLS